MTTPRSMSAGAALALVRAWPTTDTSTADRAALLLESLDPGMQIHVAQTETSTLARIYRRRVSTGRSMAGAEDLLDQLETYPRAEVVAAATTIDGWLLNLWFDDRLTQVIGCVIGQDRRSEGWPGPRHEPG